MTKWHTNQYILGSYSYIDVEGTVSHINELAKPIYDTENVPRVLFAGEATSSNFYSTVHGAFISGEREAERLTQLFFRN